MVNTISISRDRDKRTNLKVAKTLVLAFFCLGLLLFEPDYSIVNDQWTAPGSVQAAEGDTQGSAGTDEDTDDTPSQEDIADFADKYDKDGDGEVDAPDDLADEEIADEPEQDTEEDADQGDDEDHDDEAEIDRDDDDDGEENDGEDSDDPAHTGHNRDDIDGEVSPDSRLSGYDRYGADGRLRRLGGISELTPLVEREEQLILEN